MLEKEEDFLKRIAKQHTFADFGEQAVSENDASESAVTEAEQLHEEAAQAEVSPSLLQAIQQQLAELQFEIKTKVMMEQRYVATIDQLHAELQTYKSKERQDLMMPFIKDMIMVIDDLEKTGEQYELQEAVDPTELLKKLHATTQDLQDILYRHGIEPLTNETPLFDPKRQKAIATMKTNEKALDRHIARVHKKAFEWDGRIIRPELVTVYVYEEVQQQSGGAPQ